MKRTLEHLLWILKVCVITKQRKMCYGSCDWNEFNINLFTFYSKVDYIASVSLAWCSKSEWCFVNFPICIHLISVENRFWSTAARGNANHVARITILSMGTVSNVCISVYTEIHRIFLLQCYLDRRQFVFAHIKTRTEHTFHLETILFIHT